MKWSLAGITCLVGFAVIGVPMHASAQAIEPWVRSVGKLVLVENGLSRAPIVLFENAPPYIREAAVELADYIEKTSGARPDVIDGEPPTIPAHAIWVGYQPVLNRLFPDVDFAFRHAEEILITANADHLVIAGRDVWDPDHLVVQYRRTVHGRQQEYGTVNAVYTFVQEGLGVRWLWPGAMGEDVLTRKTIALDPFEYRHHPQIRGRAGILRYSSLSRGGYNVSGDWTRRQRLQLDSLDAVDGHGFRDWWDRFHQTHPEYFALQPDGTRSAFPSPRTAKLCMSNPAVWQQWLKDVEDQLAKDPGQRVFNAAPNDSWASGFCVCENCRAWDHPDAELRVFRWAGIGQEYPAISDRHVTFANHCARLLKERFPDNDYYVLMNSYGHSRPAPVKARPDDNVIINCVANFLMGKDLRDRGSLRGATYREQFEAWSKVTSNLRWRPNVDSSGGWHQGQPDIALQQAIDDMKYVAERNIIGIYIDSVWEHWGTQGPLYYVMGQLAWNPSRDGNAILNDYYQRGFSPAAHQIKAYWQLLEATREICVADKDKPHWETYNEAFFNKAQGLLEAARASVAKEPAMYAERIDFVQDGLEWTRLLMDVRKLVAAMQKRGQVVPEIDAKLRTNWERMEKVAKRVNAINWGPVMPHTPRMKWLHPDSLNLSSSAAAPATITQKPNPSVTYTDATQAGWELVFHDDFDRKSLGDTWQIIDGTWTLEDGCLVGSGTIALAQGYPVTGEPGFQRLEFEAVAGGFLERNQDAGKVRISDLSSFIHASDKAQGIAMLKTGYFFQFGGYWNTKSQIRKNDVSMKISSDAASMITPAKAHHIVLENDNGHIKCFVDQRLIVDLAESKSIIGQEQDRVGLYFLTQASVTSVRLYVRKLPNDEDR